MSSLPLSLALGFTDMAVQTPKKGPNLKRHLEDTPEKAHAQTVPEVVKRLRRDHSKAFGEIRGMKLEPGNKYTEPGCVLGMVVNCFFCNRAKHSCSWHYQFRNVRWAAGSTCLCCSEACKRLKAGTRSTQVLDKVGLKPVVAEVSKLLQASRGSDDTCICHKCKVGNGK